MRTGCDAVRLRRGGYYPPGCFPMGKTTSAHCADNWSIEHLPMEFDGTMSKHGIFCNIGTRYGSSVLPKNLQRWWAAISRPVVFPWGKQRRRIAPTMHHQTSANEIRRYHVETWYILQHRHSVRPNRFCSKICNVGGRMISAPTRSVPPKFPLGHSVAPSA